MKEGRRNSNDRIGAQGRWKNLRERPGEIECLYSKGYEQVWV